MEDGEEEEKKRVPKRELLIAKRASTTRSADTRRSCTSLNTDSIHASRLDGSIYFFGQNSGGFRHAKLL